MSVVARFYVSEVTRFASSKDQVRVVLQPVTRGEANAEWAQYTPSGKLEMNVTKGSAGVWFEERLGKEVSITIGDIPE